MIKSPFAKVAGVTQPQTIVKPQTIKNIAKCASTACLTNHSRYMPILNTPFLDKQLSCSYVLFQLPHVCNWAFKKRECILRSSQK